MPEIIPTEERLWPDDYSSDDERSSSYRRPSGNSTTVQRYNVTTARLLQLADDDDDDYRRSMRSERLEVGTRPLRLEVDRCVERDCQIIERPPSALEYRDPGREREVKRTVVYERERPREPLSPRVWERERERERERDIPFERERETDIGIERRGRRQMRDEEPVEYYERFSRETEYDRRLDPPLQPIVTREPPVAEYRVSRRELFADSLKVARLRREEAGYYRCRDMQEVEHRIEEVALGYYDGREVRPRDSVSNGGEKSEDILERRGRKAEKRCYRSHSRSSSRGHGNHTKLKTGLGLAAAALAVAAAGKYEANRNEREEEVGRGRSRSRSVPRRRRYSSDGGAGEETVKHDAKHRAATIAKVGLAASFVGGITEHIRNKSRERSKSRLGTGGVGAASAGKYIASRNEWEEERSRERSRKRSVSQQRRYSSNDGGEDLVIGVTQNYARSMVNEAVGDAAVDSHGDGAGQNPPQGDGIEPLSVTDEEDTEILSAENTSTAQFSVVDERAAVEAFITLLSEQEIVGPSLKKAGYNTTTFPEMALIPLLKRYLYKLIRNAENPLQQAAAQFLRENELDVLIPEYISRHYHNIPVDIETCLQQFSDFLIGTDAFKESSDDGDKTNEASLSRFQQVKKFLFDGPAFRELETDLLVEQPGDGGSSSKALSNSEEKLSFNKGPLKQAFLTESDPKPIDVMIPEAAANGKDISADAKQALSTNSNPKPADVIDQDTVNKETEGLKREVGLLAAAGGGHLEVVERLLAVKADVNAAAGSNGRTVLQAQEMSALETKVLASPGTLPISHIASRTVSAPSVPWPAFRIVYAPKRVDLTSQGRSIFLAGNINWGKVPAWQELVAKKLTNLPVTILNPHQPDWDSSWEEDISSGPFREQAEWEQDMLEAADVIALYFSPDTEAPISLLELGLFAASGKLLVACPRGYWKRGNVQIICQRLKVELVDDIDELVRGIEKRLHETGMDTNMEIDRKQVDLDMVDDKRLHELEMDETGKADKDQTDSDKVVESKLQNLEIDAVVEDAEKQSDSDIRGILRQDPSTPEFATPDAFPKQDATLPFDNSTVHIPCENQHNIFLKLFFNIRSVFRHSYSHILRSIRPALEPGFRRIEWHCDCGEMLYGDFRDDDLEELDELEQYLVNNSSGLVQHPMSSGADGMAMAPIAPIAPGGSASSVSFVGLSGNVLANSTPSPSPSVQDSDISRELQPIPAQISPVKKYVALCVNKGEYYIALGEIEASKIISDKEIFAQIRKKYFELRSFRARALRLFLIRPIDIKFVHFAVEDSHRVDILDRVHPNNFPPPEEVLAKRYEYSPCPLRSPPAISPNAFLHYMSCYASERSLSRGTKWFQRLPKKLQKSLEEMRRSSESSEDVTGWGIHIIEGPNVAMMSLSTGIIMTLCCIGSTIYAIVMRDVSGGFSIGAFIAALWTAWMTALFFQWKQQ